jgi:hypothetical protein
MAVAALLLAAFGAWLLGCGDEDPTGVGRDLRTPPDTLYVTTLRAMVEDSTFATPVSMGRAPVAQIGQQTSYTSHALYAFRIPTRVVEMVDGVPDTLFADDVHLSLKSDSLVFAPFTGTMRLRVLEIAPGAPRGWTRASFIDSALVVVPPAEMDPLAPDVLVVGADLANDAAELDFDLATTHIAGYDSARARGDSIEINVVVRFEGFTVPGKGFLALPRVDSAGRLRGNVIAFSNDRENAIVTAIPFRSRPVVEYSATCPTAGELAISDGFRLHTYLQFAPLRTVLAESALVFQAELVLTQSDTTACAGFSSAETDLQVFLPADTLATTIYSEATASRPTQFRGPIAAVPSTPVSVFVTPYIFELQEGLIASRDTTGMMDVTTITANPHLLLRVSAEGTRARHFEFHGAAAADSTLRPYLRIVYGYPSGFDGGGR